MNYRAVVTVAPYEGAKVRAWCEAQRDRAPRWWPEGIRRWWTRWRRVSRVRTLVTKRGEAQRGPRLASGRTGPLRPVAVPSGWRGRRHDGNLYVPLRDAADMARWVRRMDVAGA